MRGRNPNWKFIQRRSVGESSQSAQECRVWSGKVQYIIYTEVSRRQGVSEGRIELSRERVSIWIFSGNNSANHLRLYFFPFLARSCQRQLLREKMWVWSGFFRPESDTGSDGQSYGSVWDVTLGGRRESQKKWIGGLCGRKVVLCQSPTKSRLLHKLVILESASWDTFLERFCK